VVGSALLASITAYFAWPDVLPWMFVNVPAWVRVAALFPAVGSVVLLTWAHATLGPEFATTLRLKSDHKLVTVGPYAHIRHPIYTAYFVLFVATGVFTRSWIIGVLGMIVIGTLMTSRLVREESMLRERFGKEYEEYARQVGRFIPRRPKPQANRTGPDPDPR
jgi:protein-S-isoprenylcysteine O-methyltransferase Ste14